MSLTGGSEQISFKLHKAEQSTPACRRAPGFHLPVSPSHQEGHLIQRTCGMKIERATLLSLIQLSTCCKNLQLWSWSSFLRFCHHQKHEAQNQRMAWIARDLMDHQVPTSLPPAKCSDMSRLCTKAQK